MYSHAHQADRLGAHILGASTSPNSSRGGTKIFFFFEGGHRGLPSTLQLQLSCFDHFSPPKCHRPLIIRPVQPQRSHGPAPLPSALEPSARPQEPIHTRRIGGRRGKGSSQWKRLSPRPGGQSRWRAPELRSFEREGLEPCGEGPRGEGGAGCTHSA